MDLGFDYRPLLSQISGTYSDGGSSMRFIHAGAILVIAIYDLLLMNRDIETKGYVGIWTIILGVEVILFQHRSVWLAWGMGVIVTLLSTYIREKKHPQLTKQVLTGGCAGVIVLVLGSGKIVQKFRQIWIVIFGVLNGTIDTNTTLGVRVTGWVSDLKSFSMLEWIFGRPFGSEYDLCFGDAMVSPHNGYVRLLQRTGLIGLSVFLIVLIMILSWCIRNKATCLMASTICILVFMMAYDFTEICGIVIGIGLMMRQEYLKSLLKSQTEMSKQECENL